MSDPDPQTRDLRAALGASEPGARKETHNIPPLVWIVVVVLIAVAAFAWFGGHKALFGPMIGKAPPASAASAVPASGG